MSLWQCGVVAEHAGHYLELVETPKEVLLICHHCRSVVMELTAVGMPTAVAALEFDVDQPVAFC